MRRQRIRPAPNGTGEELLHYIVSPATSKHQANSRPVAGVIAERVELVSMSGVPPGTEADARGR